MSDEFEEAFNPFEVVDSDSDPEELDNEQLFATSDPVELDEPDYFDTETLKLVYSRNIGAETFLLSESDFKTIEKIRKFMTGILQELKDGKISESEYNDKFIAARKREYQIIISSSKKSERKTTKDTDIDETELEMLQRLEKLEESYEKSLGKKHKIYFPKLPKGVKKEDVGVFELFKEIELKEKGRITPAETKKDKLIEKYLIELNTAISKVNQYKPGYILAGPGVTSISKVQFIEQEPDTPYHLFEKLKESLGTKKSLISEHDEYLQQERINSLNALRKLSRDELLKCIGNTDVKFMSYIQKLKINTSPAVGEKIEGIKGKKSKELVWRLNDSVYSDFKEYLKAYAESLKESLQLKKDIITKYILEKNIEKIEYYLRTNEDPDFQSFESVVEIPKVTPKKEEESKKMRSNSRFKLTEIISEKYPGTEDKVFNLEESIYQFPGDYNENLRRVLFILYNFPDTLDNFILGDLTSKELLIKETPKVIPENDISTKDIPGSIETILAWRPTDEKEVIEWNKSLEKYELEKLRENNEVRLLRFLIRERNKLNSRREYTTATYSERSYSQEELQRIFSDQCKSGDSAKEYSKLTESIIFGMSKLPEDYRYYVTIVKSTIKSLCAFLKEKKSLEEFNPEVAIPIVTEFLINNGELEKISVLKMNELISMFSGEKFIQEYFQNLREKELSAYKEALLSDSIRSLGIQRLNRLFENINVREQILKEKRKAIERGIISDLYEPPVVLDSIPVEWIERSPEAENLILEIAILKESGENSERILELENELSSISGAYSRKYTKVGNSYVVGGNYPAFYDSLGMENYTREQLEILAGIFEIELEENSMNLWERIMYKINKPSEVEIKEVPRYSLVPPQELKTQKLIIRYAYRPRMGVPEPGEIHEVTLSDEYDRDYAVPFKWRDGWLPIYNIKLKELADNSYIKLEGPADFEESDDSTVITSKHYINVEYAESSRGSVKIFREGIAKGNIKYSTKEDFDSCNRFKNEKDCNSENSFAILDGKTRLKCKWENRKCVSQTLNPEREKFNLESVKYSDPGLSEQWKQAKEQSKIYIEESILINEPSEEELDILIWEQEDRLFQYKKELDRFKEWKDSNALKNHSIDGDGHYFEVKTPEYLKDLLKTAKKPEKIKEIPGDYTTITLYTQELIQRKLPGHTELNPKVAEVPELSLVAYSAMIHKDNVKFIDNGSLIYNGFYWNRESHEYIEGSTDYSIEVVDRIVYSQEKYIDKMLINSTGEMDGIPLVKKSDIVDAMVEMAFSTYKEISTKDRLMGLAKSGENLVRLSEFLATLPVKRFALETNTVSKLIEMSRKTVGTINLEQFQSQLGDNHPTIQIANVEIEKELLSAIEKEDSEKLKEWTRKAKEHSYKSESLERAKELLKTPKKSVEPKPEPESELKSEPEKKSVKKSNYVSSRKKFNVDEEF